MLDADCAVVHGLVVVGKVRLNLFVEENQNIREYMTSTLSIL